MRNVSTTRKMAGDEDKTPLLLVEDDDSGEFAAPKRTIRRLYESDNVLGRHSPFRDEGTINISSSHSFQNIAAVVEQDCVVSIFVVAFDTKAGNMIEWCMPEDCDLEGIEFKAMASGSHTLLKDFAYFRKGNLYGLACFENMPVESEIERGARMKSVGILATSYTLLYRHMQFLETQVRRLLQHKPQPPSLVDTLDSSHQLETPGKYTQLVAFYEDKKGTLPASASESSVSLRIGTPSSTPSSEVLPELKITHPAGCFSQFVKFFGENIFVLWKYVLLQKRILFFSPPPIGVVCYRVYCACALGNHNIEHRLTDRQMTPHFYVNVADIDTLETEMAYIACTTEKIFETKTRLYDIYVDNQNVTTPSHALQELLRISEADRDKFTKLNNQRSAQQFEADDLGEALDEEELFTLFFTEQNNRLFQTLLDVSMSQDRQLTSEHMKSMGLDPLGDRAFLMELLETYGIDVMLMVDNPCCPR